MNRAIRYRLFPTEEQKIFFAKTFGCCRKIYNLMLADRIRSYKETGKFTSGTPARYKDDFPYLREVDSLALANVQLHLNAAFRSHFDKTRKKQNAFPKFKSKKKSRRSYTTNNQKSRKTGQETVFITEYGINLPKVGLIKATFHREPEAGWKLKSATVSQDGDGKYYVSILFEFDKDIQKIPVSDNAIGLDYASDGLYVDDRGNHGSGHRFYRESEKKLAKEQRKLSRKKGSRKGEERSHNYWKQLYKVNKVHCRIKNRRKDFLHKKSAETANLYDIVCVENLDMKIMSNKGFRNGKSTLDNGYGMFLNMLEYKLEERGKYFVKVGKWYPSSQLCCRCGLQHKEMKNLQIRTMRCECGNIMSRDRNAAVNIKAEGIRMLKACV